MGCTHFFRDLLFAVLCWCTQEELCRCTSLRRGVILRAIRPAIMPASALRSRGLSWATVYHFSRKRMMNVTYFIKQRLAARLLAQRARERVSTSGF